MTRSPPVRNTRLILSAQTGDDAIPGLRCQT